MHFSPLELAIVIAVPLFLCGIVWWNCRRVAGWGVISPGFIFGALATFPIARLSGIVESRVAGLAGHFYADAFIEELFATAIPEELGKNLAALILVLVSRKWRSPLAWIICGAAAHAGFAAVEGLFSTLGDEGWLKVIVGRTLGSLSHICWGVVFMFFAWWGTIGRGNRVICAAGALAPLLLHTLINASLAEPPGAETAMTDEPTLLQLILMISGLSALAVSILGAVFCILKARAIENPSATPPKLAKSHAHLLQN